MGYEITPSSDHCYPGTAVLVNKFDIRDEGKLNEVEAVLVPMRTTEWLLSPLRESFDFDHYKAIHRHLFSDLYDWAGSIRTIDISKKGTHFCPASEVEQRAHLIFQRLLDQNLFQNLQHDAFVSEIVDFYCSTNELHPFREGNGRTQRTFFTQLIQNAGYSIDFADMDPDLLMFATIQAAHGVTDNLQRLFSDAIQP